MANAERPLSPHLSAYRWRITSLLSIFHRASGVFLSLSGFVLVGWLLALAEGPDAYAAYTALLSSLPGQIVLFAITAAAFYHLLNGIRHLFWDAGIGFELEQAKKSGWAVVIGAALLTAGFWVVATGLLD